MPIFLQFHRYGPEQFANLQECEREPQPSIIQILYGESQHLLGDSSNIELVKKIADLAREKIIDGITGVRDESDQTGMRITIDIRRDASG